MEHALIFTGKSQPGCWIHLLQTFGKLLGIAPPKTNGHTWKINMTIPAVNDMLNATEQVGPNEPLVCRAVFDSGVVIAALHPVTGPVYWQFSDESDVNAPDCYAITDSLDSATVFKSGYYNGRTFASFRSEVMEGICEDKDFWDDDLDELVIETHYSWVVRALAEKAACAPSAMVTWLRLANWVEYPAPRRIGFLRDFEMMLGMVPNGLRVRSMLWNGPRKA